MGGAADEMDDVLELAANAEREVILEARRSGTVSAAVANEVLHDGESRVARAIGRQRESRREAHRY
jgi:hypothetical protein